MSTTTTTWLNNSDINIFTQKFNYSLLFMKSIFLKVYVWYNFWNSIFVTIMLLLQNAYSLRIL